MTQLGKRLVISAAFVTISIVTIFFGPQWFFILFVGTFILFALNEFFSLAEKKGIVIQRKLGLFFGAMVPFSVYLQFDSVMFVLAILAFLAVHFRMQLRHHSLVSTAVTVFGILYIAWFCSHLIKIRDLEHGARWVFYTILLVKGGDAGAYFVGKKYGKAKLIEHISPNKSVEGAIGGFATTLLLSIVAKVYLPHIAVIHFVILGLFLGFLSLFGDLIESLLKRDAGVKDSGHVPGLGGILDVLDSLTLTIPFVYYYVTIVLGEIA